MPQRCNPHEQLKCVMQWHSLARSPLRYTALIFMSRLQGGLHAMQLCLVACWVLDLAMEHYLCQARGSEHTRLCSLR